MKKYKFDLDLSRLFSTYFQQLLDRHSLTFNGQNDYGMFVWSNDDTTILTGNNPLTGDYRDPNRRQNEVGYLSYTYIESAILDTVMDIVYTIQEDGNISEVEDDHGNSNYYELYRKIRKNEDALNRLKEERERAMMLRN